MVTTSCTRNAVAEFSAHGFESHLLRQQKAMIDLPVIAFCFVKIDMGFERVGISNLQVREFRLNCRQKVVTHLLLPRRDSKRIANRLCKILILQKF